MFYCVKKSFFKSKMANQMRQHFPIIYQSNLIQHAIFNSDNFPTVTRWFGIPIFVLYYKLQHYVFSVKYLLFNKKKVWVLQKNLCLRSIKLKMLFYWLATIVRGFKIYFMEAPSSIYSKKRQCLPNNNRWIKLRENAPKFNIGVMICLLLQSINSTYNTG